jgi:PDZ domain-containing protein
VRVPGEDKRTEQDGIYMVDIFVRKASLFERVFPQVHADATLVPNEVVNPAGLTEPERREESRTEMTVSQQVATAVALRSLGHVVPPDGAEVVAVQSGAPADGKVRAGDVIVELEDKEIKSDRDLFQAMRGRRPGATVSLTVRRGGRTVELRVGTRAAANNPARAVMGIIIQTEFHFPVDIKIDAGGIGGPSAGLAFALDIVDELGEDVDGGRKVAVTGALDLDGEVVAIGGIKQKTIGARLSGAEVFVVPDDNAAEARRYADGLRIIAVSTFEEALSALTKR